MSEGTLLEAPKKIPTERVSVAHQRLTFKQSPTHLGRVHIRSYSFVSFGSTSKKHS